MAFLVRKSKDNFIPVSKVDQSQSIWECFVVVTEFSDCYPKNIFFGHIIRFFRRSVVANQRCLENFIFMRIGGLNISTTSTTKPTATAKRKINFL